MFTTGFLVTVTIPFGDDVLLLWKEFIVFLVTISALLTIPLGNLGISKLTPPSLVALGDSMRYLGTVVFSRMYL